MGALSRVTIINLIYYVTLSTVCAAITQRRWSSLRYCAVFS